MKKKCSLVLAAALILSFVLSACGQGSQNQGSSGSSTPTEAGKTYTFRLAHITQPTHIWHKTAEKFNDELKARSNGRMELDIFPASQLGPEKDMVQQLETGTLDFAIISGGYLSTRSEGFNAWFMPFLFKDLEQAVQARNSEPAMNILKELDKQGILGMDYIFAGNRHIMMKNTTVTKPEDLKAKKIRIVGSPAIHDFWSAAGAGPTPMPLPEVYTSLQTGVIDGIDIDLDALMTEKYYETAKNFTLTNHMTWPGAFMANKAKFEAMAPEDQTIITEAVKAAVAWGSKEVVMLEKKNLKDLQTKNVTISELSDPGSFNVIRDDIYTKYSSNPRVKELIQANQK